MWNYLIITASNEPQACGYRAQLDIRLRLGLLPEVQNVLVVADPGGKRIGSGGSTLCCLMEVLQRELGDNAAGAESFREVLGSLRILIIHAGGDSKRLPAYGPCGKIFVPVPGESDSCLPITLFDRQLPTYLALPAPPVGAGQVVITSGDVMLWFDPEQVSFDKPGLTGLGCYADPRQAADHGVYCGIESGRVKLFLQKPSPEQQQTLGATDHYGQSVLDIGVMNFDADTAAGLLEIFGVQPDGSGKLTLSGEMGRAVMDLGLDFYRELCCGMGSEVTSAHHIRMAHSSGSIWDDSLLGRLLQGLRGIDFNLELLRHCDFIDFGTTRHIIRSGTVLMQQDRGASRLHSCLDINNDIHDSGQLIGSSSWVEGCRITSPLTLGGENVVLGVDIDQPLSLPAGACLDVIAGFDRTDGEIWFVRCYGVDDTFKDCAGQNAVLCGIPVPEWLEMVGASADDLWDSAVPADKRSVWDARVFPAVNSPDQYRDWLWMFEPAKATEQQLANWKAADLYSMAEIAQRTDQDAFFQRRMAIRAGQIRNSLRKTFRRGSEFSAAELTHILTNTPDQYPDRTHNTGGAKPAAFWDCCQSRDFGPAPERFQHLLQANALRPNRRLGRKTR